MCKWQWRLLDPEFFLDRRLDNFKLVDIMAASTAIDTPIFDDRK